MAFAPSPRPAPRPRTSPRSGARQAPGEVRLIGGLWKRSKLPVLDAPGLRPTPDRLRETLFNWLGQDLAGLRCLDAFAGTGALGLEAASRGAAEVLLLERDARLAQALRTTCERLGAAGVRVQVADALRWMAAQSAGVAFDVVFVDPPFDRGLWGAALDAARPLLAIDGRLYLEADRAFGAAELGERGYALLRHARAGQVHGMLLAPAAAPADALP
jgi:16S rRNA (guanine966-N2)-methyltransferase